METTTQATIAAPTAAATADGSERKCQEVLPPVWPKTVLGPSVFLAGSIEMGKAVDWQ